MVTAQRVFPNWLQTVVEDTGKGDVFLGMLMRHPGLHVMPMPAGTQNKAKRLIEGLGPWLRSGRVRISDGESKFQTALRRFLNNYPNIPQHDGGWDAADAVYLALKGMPDVLTMPTVDEEAILMEKKERAVNPFRELGAQHV